MFSVFPGRLLNTGPAQLKALVFLDFVTFFLIQLKTDDNILGARVSSDAGFPSVRGTSTKCVRLQFRPPEKNIFRVQNAMERRPVG